MAEVPDLAPAHSRPLLAGREREQTSLRAALDRALTGHGSLVLISGEAGIGKTSLAEALCHKAADRGALVLIGRCYDLSETPPYGPWRDLFARAPHGADLPALPTAVLPPEQRGAALASQEAIVARVQAYLAALAARQLLVVLLDDIHWADPASLDLLRVVARALAAQPLLVLATYRAEEVPRRHPLYALLPVLVREARAARLALRPLDDAAVRALVATRYALPADDTTRLVIQLQAQAEGNALYLGELLRALEENAVLHQSARGWTLGDPTAQPVPPLLQQVIDARVTRLGEAAGELLAVAAVLGQAVPFHLWVTVSGAPEETILGLTERAVAARLLADAPDGAGMYFAHALIREALYAGTTARRRRQTHQRAGEVLAARPDADPDVVAYHFRAAGDPRAADWLIAAGERAQRAHAWLSAGERYEAALALLEGDGARTGERGWLFYRLARVRSLGDVRQSLVALDEAAQVAEAVGDRALAAAVLEERGRCYSLLMDGDQILTAIEAGVAAVEALPSDERARLNRLVSLSGGTSDVNRVQGSLVLHRAYAGAFAEVVALGKRFVAQAPPLTTGAGFSHAIAESLGAAYLGLGIAHAHLGRPTEATRAFAEARVGFRAAENHLYLGDIAGTELRSVVLLYHPEQIAARRRLAAEAADEFRRAAGVGWTVPRLFCLPLLLLEGQWAEARALAQAGRAGANSEGARKAALGWLGQLARDQGEPDLAMALVREALPAGPATPPEVEGVEVPRLYLLGAMLAGNAGDLSAAHAWLAAHDRWLTRSGAVLGQAEGQLGWAAYHRAAGDTGQARQCAEAALAHATEPRQPLALLAARCLLGELATAAGDHAAAQAHLDEALALADACAAPYERALTLLALAEFHTSTHRPGMAQTALAAAQALLAPLDARPALARADIIAARLAAPPATAPPDGLSRREVEVLRLLAAGQSNQAIAQALFLSPRTVQRHIANVYLKIGAHNRAEATAYALHRLA